MENIKIDQTIKTPGIDFNAQSGVLRIIGRAIPENPEEFFSGIIQWVKEYFKNPVQPTYINFQLEYVNSGSSKFILEFFHIIQENIKKGYDCKVKWYYEEDDEAILELGKHYQSLLEIPFKLIELYQDDEEH